MTTKWTNESKNINVVRYWMLPRQQNPLEENVFIDGVEFQLFPKSPWSLPETAVDLERFFSIIYLL